MQHLRLNTTAQEQFEVSVQNPLKSMQKENFPPTSVDCMLKQQDFQGTLKHVKFISRNGTAALCRKRARSGRTGAGKSTCSRVNEEQSLHWLRQRVQRSQTTVREYSPASARTLLENKILFKAIMIMKRRSLP